MPETAEELLFLLKAPNQELSRVLKAAQLLLDSPAFVVPRKAHFLLDWSTNLLLKTSSRHTDPEKALTEGYATHSNLFPHPLAIPIGELLQNLRSSRSNTLPLSHPVSHSSF